MTGHHGDIMISIIHAAMLKSSDSFNPDFEVFKRDIGGLFASIIKIGLRDYQKLTSAITSTRLSR